MNLASTLTSGPHYLGIAVKKLIDNSQQALIARKFAQTSSMRSAARRDAASGGSPGREAGPVKSLAAGTARHMLKDQSTTKLRSLILFRAPRGSATMPDIAETSA